MLRRFLYLDTAALAGYLSALEDGLRQRVEDSRTGQRGGRASIGTHGVGAEASKGSSDETRAERVDTPDARFDRLVDLAAKDEEATLWAELQTLDQLADTGYGALIHVECEADVPDAIRVLSTDTSEALSLVSELAPVAEALELDMDGLPSGDQLDAMSGFLAKLSQDIVFVGEEDGSEWRIAGRLKADFVEDADVDGFVRVVGKVSKRWPENQWKPLLALPGASLVPRQERRALERKRPSDGDEDSYLQGPAVMIDVLAIYR